MKKLILLIITAASYSIALSQQNTYWQQEVNYDITVSLNDTAKTLDGYLKLHYYNHSPDTLKFIWFHLWPNAYKNDRTAFSDQLLENGRTDFYFSAEEKRGYINRLDFRVNKTTAGLEDHPEHQDIVKLILPVPLAPGQSAIIETPFHVKLPYNFSRSGYLDGSFQITQWYPKPAVYDRKGWHEMPYLDQGEFYSEFGAFNVSITVPKEYIVAATGKVQAKDSLGTDNTYHYSQRNIHDFAWFADKRFKVLQDTMQLSGRTIDVYAYFRQSKNNNDWEQSIPMIKAAIRTKSMWIGEYPYDIVSVVQKPGKYDGGMEYPTITLISTPPDSEGLDDVINHEVGHNWFYGILGSNERTHPWMDEGMNSYYDKRYMNQQYGKADSVKSKTFFEKRMPTDAEVTLLETLTHIRRDQPIETTSEKFSYINYGLVAYKKTALWLEKLEAETGTAVFNRIMQEYYNRWKFKHPYPEDFKAVAEEISGKNLDAVFSLLSKQGNLNPQKRKSIKPDLFFNLKESNKYNYIFFSPAVGYNFYDKAQIGALIHNYNLPMPSFRFLVAPLYGTGSKKLNGLARLSYTHFTGNKGANLEMSVAGAMFSADEFTDSTGKKNYLSFNKIVPTIRYSFANKNPRSNLRRYIQFKTFLIAETDLRFRRDTTLQQDIITYPVERRYVNQLQLVWQNSRALYPFKAVLQADQGKGFVRLGFTGNYFFNYPAGGGLNMRLFAGKFFYTSEKTFLTQFETDRYHLNLTGPKGNEDYTYSNYFIGRNEFEGFSNQQIMNRDGAFKVRTDLLSSKIGKTDDWLTAINLSTTIPKKINPLELLPVKIPVRIFADIGTYAEAWKKNAETGRFLYDAGLQLSLFRNTVNIYFPLLYSKVYDDYFKSTITEKRFQKNISFSIDIQNFNLKNIFPLSPF